MPPIFLVCTVRQNLLEYRTVCSVSCRPIPTPQCVSLCQVRTFLSKATCVSGLASPWLSRLLENWRKVVTTHLAANSPALAWGCDLLSVRAGKQGGSGHGRGYSIMLALKPHLRSHTNVGSNPSMVSYELCRFQKSIKLKLSLSLPSSGCYWWECAPPTCGTCFGQVSFLYSLE